MTVGSAFTIRREKFRTSILLVLWTLGSALGFFYARASGAHLVPLIKLAVSESASFSGIMVADVLPLMLCALAVFCSELWLIPAVSVIKAFSFSYIACGVSMAYGTASWLVRFLLLFSDTLLIPGFCVFVIRYGVGNRLLLRREWYIWSVLVAVVVCLDYLVISPFSASLF